MEHLRIEMRRRSEHRCGGEVMKMQSSMNPPLSAFRRGGESKCGVWSAYRINMSVLIKLKRGFPHPVRAASSQRIKR